jgi:hypothetical protein
MIQIHPIHQVHSKLSQIGHFNNHFMIISRHFTPCLSF